MATTSIVRRLPLSVCEKRFLLVWGLGSLPVFLFLAFKSQMPEAVFIEHYGRTKAAVWAWLSGLLLPTLSLIFGATMARMQHHAPANKLVERFVYRAVLVLSIVYLLLINLVVMGSGLIYRMVGNQVPTDMLADSMLALLFIQALLDAGLGGLLANAARPTNEGPPEHSSPASGLPASAISS